MEKSEAIRRFNEGKHYIETCLEQIASLEQNNDKELRQVLRGTVMVEVSYKAAENFCKVGSYVIDGKDGAQKLKDKLINMKVKVLQLYDGADRNNLLMIKNICDTIISEINEVEEWTGDNEQTNQETGLTVNNPIPKTEIISETGNNNEVNYKIFDGVEQKYINTYKKSFNYDEDKYTSFFVKCEEKTPYEIAGMLYNCNDFYNCRAIKAVYHVCVVPTMTDDNYITYESFLNHYKSIDNAQG